MTGTGLIAILPFLVLGATITLLLPVIGFRRRHGLVAAISLAGLAAALAAIWPASLVAPRQVTPLFVIDGYALFYIGLVLAAAAATLLLSYGYLARRSERREEYYGLLLLASLGAMALVASENFASFFLGLETLSISLLGLVAYPRTQPRPIEAGVKYLVLAGVSSAILLFGMALIYARLGTLSFPQIAARIEAAGFAPGIYWLAGVALIVTGLGFKLSVVPFHMWAPDVYEGAPAPVAAFIAVVSKGAVFALLLRYYLAAGIYGFGALVMMINVVAIASMLAGNLLALLQDNVKRLLAYSSIAHLGYLLLAFLAGGALAVEAVSYYLVAYFVTTLGAFGVITVLSAGGGEEGEVETLADYRGLFWHRPWLAAVFTAMLLSLAGIPLTVGFFAKFYALNAGVAAAMWPAVITLVVGSVIGLFYYLRVIVTMLAPAGEDRPAAAALVPQAGGATLAALTGLLVWLGVYPTPLIQLIRLIARPIGG